MIVAGGSAFLYFIRLGLGHWPFDLAHALVVLAACLGIAAVITGAYLIASHIPALRDHARAIRHGLLVLFFIASAGSAYYYWYWNDIRFRIASCWNHARFLEVELQDFLATNKGALPYDQGVTGFEFIARFSASSGANVNCNHGSQARIGGWQAVNLTPQLWSEVAKRWDLPKKPIPFAWCGKPTNVGQRVVILIIKTNHQDAGVIINNNLRDAGFFLVTFNMNEAELKADLLKLNEILMSVGEAPIEMDVPDRIDWAKWDMQNKKEPQRSPAN
jgi:hypothetical protein